MITFQSYNAIYYREVFLITERRGGKIYKTKRLGFCHESRIKKPDKPQSHWSY